MGGLESQWQKATLLIFALFSGNQVKNGSPVISASSLQLGAYHAGKFSTCVKDWKET
ncbi:hypothetical protein [Nibribacter koreensis]|uniref:Uncharacterized protein n=1 Tax=Nibribacter koreensis TaxID=1084519 RepID=A0ABP8F848_9BACT